MAYSVISKNGRQGNIMHFLADVDQDVIRIVDSCDPGSTVMVLDEGDEKVHTYMKSPSNKWIVVDGTTSFKIPENTSKVYAFPPTKEAPASLTGEPISTYQSNIKYYDSGYVTGTLHYARMISNTTQSDPNKQLGHFIVIGLETPEGAQYYDLYENGTRIQQNLTPLPVDDYLLVRYEALKHPENLQVKYNNDKSFTFDLTGLTLE